MSKHKSRQQKIMQKKPQGFLLHNDKNFLCKKLFSLDNQNYVIDRQDGTSFHLEGQYQHIDEIVSMIKQQSGSLP